jgi:hypothetical protein
MLNRGASLLSGRVGGYDGSCLSAPSLEGNIVPESLLSGDMKLCPKCVGAAQFSGWIRANGQPGRCDFVRSHGTSDAVVAVEDFAMEVDKYFRANYQLGEEYPYSEGDSDSPSYDRYGEPYKDILSGELECDTRLVKAISAYLPDCNDYEIAQGDEPFYDDTLNYESIESARKREIEEEEERWYERRFTFQWEDFRATVQYGRRFFKIKELLDDLFGDPHEYDVGAIKPMYVLRRGATIYRSRLLDDNFTLEKLQKSPALELGAPPKTRAPAGRMNVEYIPALYAAFSADTAIAELRPGIGDRIAVGEFSLRTELRVFDFTAFSRRDVDQSKECYTHTRYDFITQMEDEISRPILPFERQREYIPTQIVAEYLREYFNCDGVIYRSSMNKSDKTDNRNIVIFSKGDEFVGGSDHHILSLDRFYVREVLDVVYTVDFDDFISF